MSLVCHLSRIPQILHKELPILLKEVVTGSMPSPARVEMTGGGLNEHKAKQSKDAFEKKKMASTKQMKHSGKSDEKMCRKNANLQSITFKTLFYGVGHLMVDDVVEGQYTTARIYGAQTFAKFAVTESV